jgi:hypothetical protein
MELTYAERTSIIDKLERASSGYIKNLSFMIPSTGIVFDISSVLLSHHNGSFDKLIKDSIFNKELEDFLLGVGDFILVNSNGDSMARYSIGIDSKFRPVFDTEKSRKALHICNTVGQKVLDAAWEERIPLEDILSCYKGVYDSFYNFMDEEFSLCGLPAQYWGLCKADAKKEMLQDGYVYRDRVVFTKNFYPFA